MSFVPVMTTFCLFQVYRPASPKDETAELIKRLQVSVGEMSKSQTKEWYTVAKQVGCHVLTTLCKLNANL